MSENFDIKIIPDVQEDKVIDEKPFSMATWKGLLRKWDYSDPDNAIRFDIGSLSQWLDHAKTNIIRNWMVELVNKYWREKFNQLIDFIIKTYPVEWTSREQVLLMVFFTNDAESSKKTLANLDSILQPKNLERFQELVNKMRSEWYKRTFSYWFFTQEKILEFLVKPDKRKDFIKENELK